LDPRISRAHQVFQQCLLLSNIRKDKYSENVQAFKKHAIRKQRRVHHEQKAQQKEYLLSLDGSGGITIIKKGRQQKIEPEPPKRIKHNQVTLSSKA
jgi:hypothetical protein